MTLIHATRPRVAARVYAGMWVVDCPRCKGALRLDPGDPVFDCFDCGLSCEVVWPDREFRYAVARLLTMRPVSYTRNWFPGEDLHDLLQENVEHGVITADVGDVLAIMGDHIIRDTLPAGPELRGIGA